MKPSQVTTILRHIATTIENSKNPDRNLVARDIQLLINKVAGENKEALAAVVEEFGDDLVKAYKTSDIVRRRVGFGGAGFKDIEKLFDQAHDLLDQALKALADKSGKSLKW